MYCISVVSNYKNINYAINILSTSCYARKENFKSAALTPSPAPTDIQSATTAVLTLSVTKVQ